MAVFEQWDDVIHVEPAQVKRRLAGEKLKAKDVVVDRAAQCAEIQGSASIPYHTDLSGCTCPDFAVSKKPCKHMYRLALELGMIEKLPEVSKAEERSYLAAAADVWRDAFLTGKISAQTYARIGEAILKQQKMPAPVSRNGPQSKPTPLNLNCAHIIPRKRRNCNDKKQKGASFRGKI